MRSDLPKVLQPLAGKPLLGHVLAAARTVAGDRICIVYGHGGERVREVIADPVLAWAKQEPQLGTGHAVQQAMPLLFDAGTVLVLYGDVPWIAEATLIRLTAAAASDRLALIDRSDAADSDRLWPHHPR